MVVKTGRQGGGVRGVRKRTSTRQRELTTCAHKVRFRGATRHKEMEMNGGGIATWAQRCDRPGSMPSQGIDAAVGLPFPPVAAILRLAAGSFDSIQQQGGRHE